MALNTGNLFIKSFRTKNNKVYSIEVYDDKGDTYVVENVEPIEKKLKAWKNGDDEILYTKSTDSEPTKGYVATAADAGLSEVTIIYESTTPSVLYNSKTYTEYEAGDISL